MLKDTDIKRVYVCRTSSCLGCWSFLGTSFDMSFEISPVAVILFIYAKLSTRLIINDVSSSRVCP